MLISRQAASLYNLAVVYQQLGQPRWAEIARQQADRLRQAEAARLRARQLSAGGAVEWMDPRLFAQTGIEGAVPPPAASPRQAPATLPATAPLRQSSDTADSRGKILLCQALGPAAPYDICAVDGGTPCCQRWEDARLINWQAYAQGEYIGHARLPHVPEYRFRVNDQLDMLYRLTRDESTTPYKLNVGDEVRVESFTDAELNRDLLIQPDGTITLRLLGQVHATGRTVTQLTATLDEMYKKYYKVPSITVTPLRVNTQLDDLRNTVDRRAGIGGQSQLVRVTPEGLISLPALGPLPAQGLNLQELQQEINERLREKIEGMEVIPVLVQRAPRYVYVMGEVNTPGRFENGRPDHGPASPEHGRQLAGGGQSAADRGPSPRR